MAHRGGRSGDRYSVPVHLETAGAAMTTTRAGTPRVGVRQYAALLVAWSAAAVLHVWYGNRHHFFDLGIYYHAVRWWADGHDIYSYSQPDPIEKSLGFT